LGEGKPQVCLNPPMKGNQRRRSKVESKGIRISW